jgi:chromosome segregation ATPase
MSLYTNNQNQTIMANIGRKILCFFLEVADEKETVTEREALKQHSTTVSTVNQPVKNIQAGDIVITEKFKQYFEKLFKDANLPGPDYFEFSKMTEAMISIPDERTRYTAAFAGLNIQGLDKQKLLHSATQYVQVLETDAANFNSTVDAALKEKVQSKQQEIENNARLIESLSKEISALQQKITLLQNEVKENEEKIESNSGAYTREMQVMKHRILDDVEKIKHFI